MKTKIRWYIGIFVFITCIIAIFFYYNIYKPFKEDKVILEKILNEFWSYQSGNSEMSIESEHGTSFDLFDKLLDASSIALIVLPKDKNVDIFQQLEQFEESNFYADYERDINYTIKFFPTLKRGYYKMCLYGTCTLTDKEDSSQQKFKIDYCYNNIYLNKGNVDMHPDERKKFFLKHFKKYINFDELEETD